MKSSATRTLIFLCLITVGFAVLFSTLKETADKPGLKPVTPIITTESDSDLININTADADELQKLYGIGEKRAEDIIEFRKTHGRFVTKEDLMRIDGISRRHFEQIKDFITV